MSSMRDRLHVRWLFGLRQANTRIPSVFILGTVMIITVLGGLLLRSQLTAGGIAPSPAVSGPVVSGTPSSAVTQPDATTAGSAAGPGLTGYVWPLVDAKITLSFGPTDWGEYIVNG
ncbi:MAG TPA: hypothetical protein VF293_04045, partial [Candidatus Limnocylindrales bacterium]